MPIPKPGTKVRGSNTGSPIMAVFDLLGRRWALGIIWNMSTEPVTFRVLQDKCISISPSILNARLKDLKEADIIERTVEGYILTERGLVLQKSLGPIGDWSLSWAKEVFGYTKP